MTTPSFSVLLKMIEDRSAALRAAAGKAGLDSRVPGCPDWTVRGLIAHLGEVQRFWAAAVAAGTVSAPPADDEVPDRAPAATLPADALLSWSVDATDVLIRALIDAGQDRPCWTWWQESGAPLTAGAVARHQVQEAGVHAFDAQAAAGRTEPLPPDVAADGIGEYLTVGMASMGPWPHEPAMVGIAVAGGSTWIIDLGPGGSRPRETATRAEAEASQAGGWLRGTANDLVLALYGRSLDVVIEGDRDLVTRLLAWTNND
jgi:uncharacterized protein (TIGR03083 family)